MATVPETAVVPLDSTEPPPPRRLSTAPFATWEYGDAVNAMKSKLPLDYTVRKAYAVDKDHYREGKEWVGPGTASRTGKIADQFAPEDAVGEVLSNVSNAFSEPQIGAVPIQLSADGQQPSEEVQRKQRELTSWISNWWDAQRLQELIQDRQETGAWAGYASLRLWIPWRFMLIQGEMVGIQAAESIEEALSFIHVNAPLPDIGTVYTDPGTMDKCAIFFDEEIVTVQGKQQKLKRVELVYLDPDRDRDEDANTIIRVVYADKKRAPVEATLELGGRLMAAEMSTKALLTNPVLRTQRQLNLLTTIVTRIAEAAAFRERYIKNAKPQGTRIPYEEGDTLSDGAFLERDAEGRLWAVVPQERTLGAALTTELVGLPQYDEKGDEKGNQMPDIVIADPVDPKPYLEAGDATRRRILRMCAQGHLGGISNAEASGIAYEQARAVFEKDLNKRRTAEEGMLRDFLTAAIALAETISGQAGYFTDVLRITVDQRIDPGPRSPDLVRLDHEAYQAGLLSRETSMDRIGVEDVNAEIARVQRSVAHIMEVIEKAASAANAFDPDSIIAVLQQLGLPNDIIALLKAKEIEPQEPRTPPTE